MPTPTSEESRGRLVDLASDLASLQQKAEAWFLERSPAIVPVLVAGLDDDGLGSVGHWRILRLLGHLALPETYPAVRAAFERALRNRDPIVLPGAMEALASFRTPQAAAALAPLLGSDDLDLVRHAAVLLGSAGDPASVEPLARLLGDERLGVSYAAAQGLLELGTPAARAALARHLRHQPGESVRRLIEDAGIGEAEDG